MIIRLTSLLLAATTASLLFLGATADPATTEDWKLDLDRANALLAQGKYTDAIALYDDVIRTSLPSRLTSQKKTRRITYHTTNVHFHISDYRASMPPYQI
jgi:hypothetical protein